MEITRRSLVTGLVGLVAAPAIVRASSLMPVKVIPDPPISAIGYGKSPVAEFAELLDEYRRKLIDELTCPAWIVDGDKPIRQIRPDPATLTAFEQLRSELA